MSDQQNSWQHEESNKQVDGTENNDCSKKKEPESVIKSRIVCSWNTTEEVPRAGRISYIGTQPRVDIQIGRTYCESIGQDRTFIGIVRPNPYCKKTDGNGIGIVMNDIEQSAREASERGWTTEVDNEITDNETISIYRPNSIEKVELSGGHGIEEDKKLKDVDAKSSDIVIFAPSSSSESVVHEIHCCEDQTKNKLAKRGSSRESKTQSGTGRRTSRTSNSRKKPAIKETKKQNGKSEDEIVTPLFESDSRVLQSRKSKDPKKGCSDSKMKSSTRRERYKVRLAPIIEGPNRSEKSFDTIDAQSSDSTILSFMPQANELNNDGVDEGVSVVGHKSDEMDDNKCNYKPDMDDSKQNLTDDAKQSMEGGKAENQQAKPEVSTQTSLESECHCCTECRNRRLNPPSNGERPEEDALISGTPAEIRRNHERSNSDSPAEQE